MSTLETNSIGKYSGNNVSVDDALNLKSYDTAGRDALTAVAGDTIYNSDTGTIDFYNGTSWFATSGSTFNITVDYLVVAGGGSGGSRIGAGGGAGGMRSTIGNTGGGGTLESSLTLSPNTNYTVDIGGGGTAVVSNGSTASKGNNGNNTTFATVTATGGGGGGAYFNSADDNGKDGGSSGGGSYSNGVAGNRTSSPVQGNVGGDFSAGIAAGGGGGAGAAGQDSQSGGGGNGGAGAICNILTASQASTESVGEVSGSDVYYAGGGGGSPISSDNGGLGGGSQGATNNDNATAATANTGGGGGGGRNASDTNNVYGGAGGSGVVILKYSDAYTITGTGVTFGNTYTSGGYKVTPITQGTGTVSFS
jgi:hypothetical protein